MNLPPLSSFELALPGRILFGEGRLEELGNLASGFGRRVALVTGRGSAEASGLLARVEAILGGTGIRHLRIAIDAELAIEDLSAALAELRPFEPQCVVAIGGGSALDGGKALAALLGSGGEPLDYLEGVGRGRAVERTLPMIAIPTTAGTGSEATKNAVIGDAARTFKKSMRSELMLPAVALVDPALLESCPAETAAACGLDALVQILEAFTARRASPLTDALAREGLARIGALGVFLNDPADLAARRSLALGSLIGGICLANAGLGAVHALASPIGAFFPAPHGVVCAALLPAVVETNAWRARKTGQDEVLVKYWQAWPLLVGGVPDEGIEGDPLGLLEEEQHPHFSDAYEATRALADALGRLVDNLAIPRLGEFGMTADDIPRVIEHAGQANLRNNPVELTPDDLAGILESAL